MPRNTKSASRPAEPHQTKGGLVRRQTVADKIETTVAQIRREHYAGTLPRRRLTFNYVVRTRAGVTPATIREDYHKTSSDLVDDLLEEVNGDAGPPIKAPRKPRPRAPTLSDRVADMAREIEIVKYSKSNEVKDWEERFRKLSEETELLRGAMDDLRRERDSLRDELKRFRPLVVDRRSTTSPRRRSGPSAR
jgi:hypothetical protein